MLIGKPRDIVPSEITPQGTYLRRREILAGMGALGLGIGMANAPPASAAKLTVVKSPLSTSEPMTPLKDVTSYNNYYEFGTDKGDPAENAHTLKTTPWSIKIDGMVAKPATLTLEDVLKVFERKLQTTVLARASVEGEEHEVG